MYFSRKKAEDMPQELTVIWSCTQESCKGWIRDDFAFEDVPTCHQCQSPMKKSVMELPLLVNNQPQQKKLEKGIPIKKATSENE